MKPIVERFLKYVKKDTTANPNSNLYPSSNTQLEFANFLKQECMEIGLTKVTIDLHGYVFATLEGNVECDEVIGFIAHMDTSPEVSGTNINPQIVENYDGQDIIHGDFILSPTEFPALENYIGQTLITTDGTTLLGADDKAGIAEIITAMEYLVQHPEIPHGTIKIAFTPDEEIGKGVDFFNVEKFGADYAYTIDGGEIGELQYENFNAAKAIFEINGKNIHPGYALNTMVNATLIANEIINTFPEMESPANTSNYEGFYHVCELHGSVSQATLTCIVRDFDERDFKDRKQFLKDVVEERNYLYDDAISLTLTDEYANMDSIIRENMHIISRAKESMESVGVVPKICPIRGGTDGARLSFMNLPCPNLFTGGHNFHGVHEFIPVPSMEKAVETIIKIAEFRPKPVEPDENEDEINEV